MGFKNDTTAIEMAADRGARFHDALCEAMYANDNLAAVAKDFPFPDIGVGEVHPQLAVEAMTKAVAVRLSLLLSMLNNEERVDHPAKEGE